MTQQADEPKNDISRNFLLGNRKKIAKFLMRTFTCRSTFLYTENGVMDSARVNYPAFSSEGYRTHRVAKAFLIVKGQCHEMDIFCKGLNI